MKSRPQSFNIVKKLAILSLIGISLVSIIPCRGDEPASKRYLKSVKKFADTIIEKGRDTYGDKHTPLFVDGLHVVSLEPVIWKKDGQSGAIVIWPLFLPGSSSVVKADNNIR